MTTIPKRGANRSPSVQFDWQIHMALWSDGTKSQGGKASRYTERNLNGARAWSCIKLAGPLSGPHTSVMDGDKYVAGFAVRLTVEPDDTSDSVPEW